MSFIQELFTSRNNGVHGADFVGKQGRIWWDPVSNCLYYSDGVTPGGIPIGQGEVQPYGEFMTETFIASSSQDTFELLHPPSGHVTGSINGATMAADALVENGVNIQYLPDLNENYVLQNNDVVTFSYLFGTVRASTIGDLGDVHLGNVQGGQVLIYDGRLNMWVAGNPNGALQNGIQNGTTLVRILDPNGQIAYKISGVADKIVMTTAGINVNDAGYSVNGHLAVNGPTIQIENRNTAIEYDMCDRPIDTDYNQSIPVDTATTVEYNRLCWDTTGKFNPTANPITIGGVTIQPWSWRPMIDGYYTVTARLSLDDPSTPVGSSGTQLVSEGVVTTQGQTVFFIADEPKGTVVFVINGATVPATATQIQGKKITYVPANNSDYVIRRGDDVGIHYIVGGGPELVFVSESVSAIADQTEFMVSSQSTGVVIASLNGATLSSYAMLIDGTDAVYSPVANDSYSIKDGDIVSFNYFTGSSGSKLLTADSFYARSGQIAFNLTETPSGSVIASLNGAVLPTAAVSVNRRTVVYDASGNSDYQLRTDDVITFTYIGKETEFGSEDWAALSIVVNGTVVSTGCKASWINKTIDVEVDTILKLTPTDNISIQVKQHTDQPLRVLSSVLSSSMVRGIE